MNTPEDKQAAAALRLSEQHNVAPLRIFNWAHDCGVDLSDMSIEESLYQANTEAFDYAVNTGTCPKKKSSNVDLKNQNSKLSKDTGAGLSYRDIKHDFRF